MQVPLGIDFPRGPQKRKVQRACSVETGAVQLVGGDDKSLKEFVGVRASDLKELLPGVEGLSEKAMPTTCLARRKGVGFVKASRPGCCTEANILWRVDALDAAGASGVQ